MHTVGGLMVKYYFLVGKDQQGYLDALETIYKNNHNHIGAASIEDGRKDIHALKKRKLDMISPYYDEKMLIEMKRLGDGVIKVAFYSKGRGNKAYAKNMKDAYFELAKQFGCTDV
jgi:hypothetical protein